MDLRMKTSPIRSVAYRAQPFRDAIGQKSDHVLKIKGMALLVKQYFTQMIQPIAEYTILEMLMFFYSD
jgi:hypothetical protein